MSTSFSFGTNTTAAPAFGSTTLTFGGSTNQPQPAGLNFGSTPAPSGNMPSLFGTPVAAPATTSLFGTPAVAPSTGMFSTPAPNLPFGTPNTVAPNLPFGTPNTIGLTLTPANTATTGLSFGTPATTTAPPPSFGLSTGQPTASAPMLGSSLGAISTSTAAPSFGFGLPTTTTGGLKLGTIPATVATTGGLNFGLGGITASSTSTGLTPATNAPVVGLGGIATSTQARSSTITAQKEVPPKDQPLPNEILQTVEAFKDMVKQQKSHSSDISRCSVGDFRRVEKEIDQLSCKLNSVETELQKNRQIAEKLKYDTAKTVQNVEMAQRTHDTPPGLQYENTEPIKFFFNLADKFERDMQNLKIQIDAADKYVKNHKNPDSLTPQDLSTGMRRLHETFVALAGRLQSIHNQVELQKETYLNIRKHLLQDTSNPFDELTKGPQQFQVPSAFVNSPPKVATGPTPFNSLALRTINMGAPQQHTTPPPPPAYPGTSNIGTGFGTTAFGTPLGGTQPSNTSLFGSSAFGQSSFNNNSFQLQKPPTSNKRGKM